MAIAKILQALSEKISAIIFAQYGVTVEIELANVATLNDGDEFVKVKSAIVLSIVNIEQDSTTKNQTLYKAIGVNATTVDRYKNPAQNLIISILFTSYNKDQSKYSEGLDKLAYIIKCLQNNNVYYYGYSNIHEQSEISETQQKILNKLTLDMVSLKMDQLNQMWTCLGSKYMPSVLYSMKMVRIQNETLETDPLIKKVKIQLWENEANDPTGLLESGEFTNQ